MLDNGQQGGQHISTFVTQLQCHCKGSIVMCYLPTANTETNSACRDSSALLSSSCQASLHKTGPVLGLILYACL